MRFKAHLKYLLHTQVPGFRGNFPYFGTRLFFPKESQSFWAICEQGIFERENLSLSVGIARQNSVVYDVGANIGQSAAPLLSWRPDIEVVSFEPSPNSLPSLRRTIEGSPHRKRWTLVEKAVGASCGTVEFQLAPAGASLYEGTVHTARAPHASTLTVEQVTLDQIWTEQGRPDVSLIKVDTEGGEAEVLAGAGQLMGACGCAWLIEWNAFNLAPRGIDPASLLTLCHDYGLAIYSVPGLARIDAANLLAAAMASTETFLLLPKKVV